MSLGEARVALPPNLKRPGSEASSGDESTDVARLAIQSVELADEATLSRDVQMARIQAKLFKTDLLIFIHGYNVSFENALRRAAQIAYDLNFDGPTLVFNWPSQARLWGYLADRDEVDVASGQFRQFLAKVIMKAKPERVHFIAHSMGNLVLLRALETVGFGGGDAQLPLGAIITAAPDVDPDVFAQFANRTSKGGANLTLYVPGDDRALCWLRQTRATSIACLLPRWPCRDRVAADPPSHGP